jgi:hypothetical protein
LEVFKLKKISTFSLGLVVGITLTAGTTIGAANFLKATPKTVSIVVGSNKASVSAMNVNEKLYIPVRDAATSFGYSVSGVTSTTVTFAEGKTAVTTNSGIASTTTGNTVTTQAEGQYVDKLHDKYSTDGKLDANKVKMGIAAGEITVNSQDAETGNSLMHFVVLESNFCVYSVIKVNNLNVNLVNNEGQTALMLAVINENDFYYGELTNHYKSKAAIKDNSGKIALDYAKKNSSFEIGLEAYMLFNKE